MSDIVINNTSFNQAYRGYAVEQGNDAYAAQLKADETATQTESASDTAAAQVADDVYISPAAAKLYAEQTRRRRSVTASEQNAEAADAESATAELDFEPVQGVASEQKENHEQTLK